MSDAAPQVKRSRATLWLIIALAAAPVVASYLLYYFWPPARSVNYGELIGPKPLPDPPLAATDGTPFRLSQLKGKWVLVSLDSGRCDEACDRKLLYMRQLRLTQGKEMDRVERLWLVVDGAPLRAGAVEPYAGTWVARADAGLAGRFPAPDGPTGHIYVVDPLGNLMMRFPRDPEPRRMIRDLQRLLRASQVG
jgi:cytochrome oxidase Cu insertion factor (SCO1/SenC/PrrC family)